MRFLVDECTGPAVAQWLQGSGHVVFSVFDEEPGVDDEWIIRKAFAEDWIVITNDKDFGEKVFREKFPHHGVIFLRLEDERAANKIRRLKQLLERYSERIHNAFVVLTETRVRFGR